MRITRATFTLLAAASIAISGCGGGGEGGGGGGSFDSPNNLPPVITGTPPTKLSAGTQYSFQPQSTDLHHVVGGFGSAPPQYRLNSRQQFPG